MSEQIALNVDCMEYTILALSLSGVRSSRLISGYRSSGLRSIRRRSGCGESGYIGVDKNTHM